MKIVIPDPIWGIPEKYWDELRGLGAKIYTTVPASEKETFKRIGDAEIITLNYINADKRFIDAAPRLKYIISPAVGYDWIDTAYATTKGIKVLNCPTFVPRAVAEHALALILSLAKRLGEAQRDMGQGVWKPNTYVGLEVSGKTLGLVGYGNIGKHLERMVSGLDMKVIHGNSRSTPGEIDRIFTESDIVCLCLPLNDQTRHLVDNRRLKLLKKSAYLINVARGALIDQSALLQNLQRNNFAGAGLDVFENEPRSANAKVSTQILELVNLPNVVATPHSAFNTPETLERLGAEVVANIQSCLDNKPQNVVN